MNRKSRLKSTLDSLFSSNKNQGEAANTPPPPQKPEKKEEIKPVEKKAVPAAPKPKPTPEKTDKPAAVQKQTAEKIPEAPRPAAAAPKPEPVTEAPVPVKEEKKETLAPAPVKKPETPAAAQAAENKPVEKPAEKPETAVQSASRNDGNESGQNDEEVHLVVFLLAGEAFGIGIQMVESIIKKQAITKVPHAEKFILGVTNLRGTVVPVVDLRQRFCMPEQSATKDTRIIVLNTESGKNGILVDEVMEVMRVPKSAISPTPPITTTINSSFIKGIARTDEKLIILLDVNNVLIK